MGGRSGGKRMSEAAKAYEGQGYYIHSEPLLPPDLVQRARAGMDAVRCGEYDTGGRPSRLPGIRGMTKVCFVKLKCLSRPIAQFANWSDTKRWVNGPQR